MNPINFPNAHAPPNKWIEHKLNISNLSTTQLCIMLWIMHVYTVVEYSEESESERERRNKQHYIKQKPLRFHVAQAFSSYGSTYISTCCGAFVIQSQPLPCNHYITHFNFFFFIPHWKSVWNVHLKLISLLRSNACICLSKTLSFVWSDSIRFKVKLISLSL